MKNKVCYWDEVIGSQVERETTPEEDAEVLVRQGEAVISARNPYYRTLASSSRLRIRPNLRLCHWFDHDGCNAGKTQVSCCPRMDRRNMG